MKNNKLDRLLSEEFGKILKRKICARFKDEISMSRKIHYFEFRKFCGRSFGLKKSETNNLLDILRDHRIVELSSSGFVVRNKKFFDAK